MKNDMDKTTEIGTIDNSKITQKEPVHMDPSEWQFDDDTIMTLSDLGDVLRRIHNRMESEGYEIVDGQVKKLEYAKF